MAVSEQPIIIKKIKKSAHVHHGGSWKVAYADFVTAMMAFFLLLWLLSVTTPEKRAAIADYFTPTIGIKDSRGIGLNGGRNTQLKKGRSLSNLTSPGLVIGQVQQGPVAQMPEEEQNSKPDADSTAAAPQEKKDDKKAKAHDDSEASGNGEDSEQFSVTEQEINQALQNDQDLKQLKNSVQIEESPEGMKINLIDDPKEPMFTAGGATLTDAGKKVLDSMANIIAKTPNQIAILGHTDADGPSASPHYTNWELSVDRANAVRRALVTTQIGTDRVAKVVGLADRELLVKEEPNNPRNRRVTLLLLRGSYARDPNKVPASPGRSELSVGDAKIKTPDVDQPDAPAATPAPARPSIFDVSNESPKPAPPAPATSKPDPAVPPLPEAPAPSVEQPAPAATGK